MRVELKILDSRITGLAYAKPGDAGVDLRACSIDGGAIGRYKFDTFTLLPGDRVKVGTGVAVHLGSAEIDGGKCYDDHISLAGFVLPRSGLGDKGIRLGNTIGLIDREYQGEITLSLENAGREPFTFEALNRLAQYVVVPVFLPVFEIVSEFSVASERGASGFGSTGTKGGA